MTREALKQAIYDLERLAGERLAGERLAGERLAGEQSAEERGAKNDTAAATLARLYTTYAQATLEAHGVSVDLPSLCGDATVHGPGGGASALIRSNAINA